MVALVGNDAGAVFSLADAKKHGLRRQRPFRHAAQPFDADKSVGLDLAHDETQLVHMGEQHDRWRCRIAFQRCDQIAQPVGPGRQPESLQARSAR